uniref:Conserved oligomeric Golgi complex subunit 3 C-terminal domain-containing protein n=1 Tax=Odontella aurita TaxID=265563 RepID=A0A7S4J589_9STRA
MSPPPPPAPSSSSSSFSAPASDANDNGSMLLDATLAQTYASTDHLSLLLKHAASLRFALRASINIADDVGRRHADLLRQSGELSAAAERLQAEADVRTRHAEEIGMPLRHYDAVDRIGVLVGVLFKDGGRTIVRGLARLKVDSDGFEPTLDEIDDALAYFENESGGREALDELHSRRRRRDRDEDEDGVGGGGLQSGSLEYYRRALALHDAALFLIREAVADRIGQTARDVASALDISRKPIAANKLEASLVYTRFHGISVRSNALISIVKDRLDRNEAYGELLDLCRNSYCGGRETLLRNTVRAHMDKLRDRHGLVGMTRLASVFLIRLCTVETSLYLDFFGNKKKPEGKSGEESEDGADESKGEAGNEEDKVAVEAPSSGGSPRVKLSRKTSSSASGGTGGAPQNVDLASDPAFRDVPFQTLLANLCASLHRTVRRGLVAVHDLDTLCQVVSVLREERGLADSGPTTSAAARAIGAVIVDAQERLIFCANAQLHKEVVRFKAGPEDLDYPGKLLRGEAAEVPPLSAEGTEGGGAVTSQAPPSAGSTGSGSSYKDDDAIQAQLRVYESWFPPMRSVLRVLSKIFRVVEPRVFEDIALQSVGSVTRSLKDGSAYIQKKSGTVHADLFLVKHLLILREQLSPFDIQLRSVERQLDFSEAGKAVTRFLANRNRRLFSLSTENALVALLREGVSIHETSVDSKRDLDDALRSACNDFIEHTSGALCGPALLFVENCKGASASADAGLMTQPFMAAHHVLAVMGETTERLPDELAEVSTQMGLYLENPATQSILLKPVVRKITRALEDARRFVGEAVDGECGWDAEARSQVLNMMQSIEVMVKGAVSRHSSRQ